MGEIALKTRETIKKICQQHSIEIIAGHIRPEHIHLVASIPPNLSISNAMQYIKGKSANQLLREFEQQGIMAEISGVEAIIALPAAISQTK